MANLKPLDHVLITVKAGLNAVPIVGGVIASLIGDYVPLSTQRSLERATQLLSEKLVSLEGRVDAEAVNKDEFSDLFKSCYLVIVRTTQEAKLRAAAAIFANLLLKDGDPDKASYTELDHFVRCLDGLSSGAIAALATVQGLAVRSRIRPDADGDVPLSFEQLQSEFGPVEPSLLMGLVGELSAFNLLRNDGRPPIPTSQYGNYRLTLTPIGRRFVQKFLES